jgi:hypothetical protein
VKYAPPSQSVRKSDSSNSTTSNTAESHQSLQSQQQQQHVDQQSMQTASYSIKARTMVLLLPHTIIPTTSTPRLSTNKYRYLTLPSQYPPKLTLPQHRITTTLNHNTMTEHKTWSCTSCGWLNPPINGDFCVRCGDTDRFKQFRSDQPGMQPSEGDPPGPPEFPTPPRGMFPGGMPGPFYNGFIHGRGSRWGRGRGGPYGWYGM